MTTPYYQDDSVTLYHGADIEVLRELPDQSVNCCVTSPPYFGLRDYGVEGQRGLEQSPAEYVAGMVEVFAEIRRTLADDGTLWLNLGDSYSASTSNNGGYSTGSTLRSGSGVKGTEKHVRANLEGTRRTLKQELPAKNLLGIPWRVALALQDDGWILRNAIIWHKTGGLPTSAVDRMANKYEHVFLFSKTRRYFFDLEAIKTPAIADRPAGNRIDVTQGYAAAVGGKSGGRHFGTNETSTLLAERELVNPGDVWKINPQPFAEAHFACMPPNLAERCVLAGCKPGGVVLDPYSGSGTTGMVATRHGRRYVGIDLNRDYLDLSLRTRLGQATITDGVA